MARSKTSQGVFHKIKRCNPSKEVYNYNMNFVRVTQKGGA